MIIRIKVKFPSDPIELPMILMRVFKVGQDFASLKTLIYLKETIRLFFSAYKSSFGNGFLFITVLHLIDAGEIQWNTKTSEFKTIYYCVL